MRQGRQRPNNLALACRNALRSVWVHPFKTTERSYQASGAYGRDHRALGTLSAVTNAPAAERAAAANSPHCHPELSGPTPAAIATPASCATRLIALLMPEARPSSDVV